jgi:hypothetical protein
MMYLEMRELAKELQARTNDKELQALAGRLEEMTVMLRRRL